ncbi:uncharacterized protein LOC125731271 isoform X2 [Brienomyrus brachyistius]|uniref:uncharacterized protein LOC125731271 isoform X2 n=1 Tax=Brienomyrus brachyistius TaxID=42636 RepID=UPI0020B2F2AC|nr:uncharacterized protein LOC125731271 isoform X2 [Brienomyrus brachyistius]
MEFAGESLHFGGSAPLGSHESQPWEQDMRVEARQPERRASVSSEESDIEAPPVIARKVSFADAFGLDLVSVKEFDTWNTPTPAAVSPSDHSSLQDSEEYCLSHLFAVPSSAEELRRILQEQKVQLEHVELLPGTTSLRGTIRVLNLCFDKQVYARTTLDKWGSRFDLLAEFVPGSSDGETDRFSFMFSLMPPSEGQRGRVEFCLRYETTMGTFWDNNGGRNYVLFYDRRTVRDMKAQVQEELFQPNKKSCLKASRDSPADFHLAKTPVEIPDATGIDKDVGSAGTQLEEGQESEGCDWHSARRSRRRMARLVQLQDHFSRREAEPVRAITPEPPAVGVSPSESATPCPPGQCKSDEQAQSHPQATLPLGDADSKSRQAASMPTDPWESFLSIDNTVHATALEMATSSSPFLDLPPSCLQDVISQLDFSSRPPVLMENHEGCCTRGSDWHPLWGDLEVEICRVNTKGSYSGRDDRLLGHDPHVESESHEGSCSQTELYKEDADVRGSREQAGAIRGGDSNAQLNSAALPVGHLTAIAVDHFPVSSLMTPVTGIHCPTENDKAGFLLGGRRGASEKDEPADKIQNTAAKEEISLGEADDRLTEKDKIVSCSPEVAVREPIDNLVDISPGGLVNHSVKMAVDVLVNQSSDISAAELISNSTEISAEELVDKLAKISTSELVNHSAEIGADEKIDHSAEMTACELADNSAEISAVQLLHHSSEISADEHGDHSSEISAGELADNSAEITAVQLVDYLTEISASEQVDYSVNHSDKMIDKLLDHSSEITAGELADNSAEIRAVQLLHHSAEISADELVDNSVEITAVELVDYLTEISASEQVDYSVKITPSDAVNHSDKMVVDELVKHSAKISADEHGDNSSEITAGELADNSAENSAVQLVHHSAEISADELVDNSVEITADELVEYLTEISASEQVDYSVKITPSEAVNHSDKMVVDEFVKHSAEISADELADNSAEISTIQLVHHSAEISADELVENSDEITTVELVEYLTEISTSEQVDYSVKITSSEPVNHSDKMVVDELFKHSAEISADEHGDHSAEITADELVDNSVNHSDKIIDKLLDHSSEISADELVDNSAEITAVELVHYSAEISVNGLNKDAIKMIPGNITSNQPVGHSDRIHPGQVIDHIVQCYGDHSEWRVDTSGTSQSATLHLLNTNSVERILLEYKEDRTMSPITDSLVYNRDCHTEMDIVNIPQELSIQDEEKEATRDEGDCGRSQANDPDERQQVDAYRLRDIEKVKRRMENASRGKEGGEVTRGRERSHAARETVVLLHAKGRGFLSTKSKGKSSDLFKAGLEDSMDAGKASYVGQDMGVEEGNLHSTIVSLPGNNELRVKDLQRQEERQPPASAVEGLPTPASTRCSARDWGDHMPCILTDEDAEDSQGIAVPFHLTLGTQKEPIAVRMSPEERAEAKNMGYMLHLLGIITPHHLTRTVLYVVLLAVLCVAVYQYGFLACFALYLCLACLLSHHREKQDLQERDRTKQSENKEYRP